MANYSNEYATSGNTHQHKIKRTVEHILTWVGVVLQALVAILFLLAKPFLGNDSFKDQMVKEAQKQGEQISTSDINQGFDALSGVINFFTWGAIIPLILAIIGGLLISKAPKIAGILILIAGFIALASNWISVVLWIVAGIMLLVRKGKKKDYDNRYYANDSKYDDHNHNHNNRDYDNHNRAYDDRHDNNFDNRHNSNHRDDLHRSNDNDFQRENNTDWTSEKDRHDVSDDHDHRDNNELGRNLANNEERHFNDADRSQGYDEDNHFRRSDRYNEDNHEFGNTNNEHQDHHRDNDFLQDETQKLKDKNDNDPYKY
ncbi:DUF4064 domain-containing protein [Staphylococcus devriesei]|uniref:DUF4064 domain-containing protein n=1 Tax=Staphylococcus devriesei TaxID=586733 RepID=UPI001F23032B|nr:DUF4064 domain-containing protein [Staphylococcus devriesei]MCE5090364.1 DUF4064 domain-containing protein [Staphylococcus devriesei]